MIFLFVAFFLTLFFLRTDFQQGLSQGLALLLVACPCGVGVAMPMIMALAHRRSVLSGLAFRNDRIIERLASVKHMVWDKTGTLTAGEASVAHVRSDDKELLADLLPVLATLHQFSNHEMSLALDHWAKKETE